MTVDKVSQQAEQRHGHSLEESRGHVDLTIGRCGFWVQPFAYPNSIVAQGNLLAAETALELKEAGIPEIGATERELLRSGLAVVADRFPHQQAVGTEVLEGEGRGTELIECLGIEVQKDASRDPTAVKPRQQHEPVPRRNHVLMKKVEEAPRLWRGILGLLPSHVNINLYV